MKELFECTGTYNLNGRTHKLAFWSPLDPSAFSTTPSRHDRKMLRDATHLAAAMSFPGHGDPGNRSYLVRVGDVTHHVPQETE